MNDRSSEQAGHAVVLPPGLSLPPGDTVELAEYDDADFGFLRVTLDANKHRLKGEYFAAFTLSPTSQALSALHDSFALDLRSHNVD